jgi:hypothetical protein
MDANGAKKFCWRYPKFVNVRKKFSGGGMEKLCIFAGITRDGAGQGTNGIKRAAQTQLHAFAPSRL